MQFVEKIIKEIEDTDFTITQWVVGFTGIMFVRFVLESLSTKNLPGIVPFTPSSLIHVGLFFLSVVLGTIYIVSTFSGEKKVYKTILLGLPIIWVAPIIDIVLSKGNGFLMTYIRDTHGKLLWDFLTFFGVDFTNGATYGMRVEIAAILFFVGVYVYIKKKSLLRSLLSVLVTYMFGFIIACLPGIIYTVTHPFYHPFFTGTEVNEVLTYIAKVMFNSNIIHNTPGLDTKVPVNFFELGFDRLMSQILFLVSCIFSILIFKKISRTKFDSIIKNLRPERLNFYTLSIICGAGFAYINDLGIHFAYVDLLGFACLLTAWVGLWMQAVHQNDIADIKIDEISNKNRPLIKNELSVGEMKDIGNLWLILGILGAYLASFYAFFMALVYISASYIYSMPPLRLRRFPLIPSFLISVACLATVMSGFFFVSVSKDIRTFPILLAIGILVTVTLAINFKDLKDVEGDKANGIITLPILFKEDGVRVVGICMATSIMLVPFFLSFYFLFIFAIPLSFAAYKATTRKPYKEKTIFVIRFIFLSCIALTYLISYFLAK